MRRPALPLAVSVGATTLFCILTIVMLGGGMAGFDTAVRNTVHAFAAPWLTACAEAATMLGSLIFLVLLGAIALVFLLRAGRRWDAAFLVFVMAGAVVLDNAVKFAIRRPRPPPFFGTDPATYSYPSGHALFSLCFYGALAIVLAPRGASRAAPWALAVCLALTIGATRIYLGVHYPSDVLAGYLLATAWLSAALATVAGRAPPGTA